MLWRRWLWRLHDSAAGIAGAVLFIFVKAGHDRRQLFDDVRHFEILIVEFVAAVFAKPKQAIFFTWTAVQFHDQADAASRALGRMRHFGGQQKNFTLLDRDSHRLTFVDDAKHHVPFHHVVKLFGFVVVVVFAAIRASNDHNDEVLVVIVHHLVANGWFEAVPVVVDPLLEIDRFAQCHDAEFWLFWPGGIPGYCRKGKAFGGPLTHHQIVHTKARQVEHAQPA